MSCECSMRMGGLTFKLIAPHRLEFISTMMRDYEVPCDEKCDVEYRLEFLNNVSDVLTQNAQLLYEDFLVTVYYDGGKIIRRFGISNTGGKFYLYLVRSVDRFDKYTMLLEERYFSQLQNSKRFINMMAVEEVLLHNDAVILHAVMMESDGEAILLTAPSGTGKTTHSLLWQKLYNVRIINGDRAIIRRKNGAYYAYGSPYTGSSGIGLNVGLPLRAIAVIRQNANNSVRPCTPSESFRNLFTECVINNWSESFVEEATEQLTLIADSVPVVLLKCNMEDGAATTLRNFIYK